MVKAKTLEMDNRHRNLDFKYKNQNLTSPDLF